MRYIRFVIFGIVAASFVVALYFYPMMPDQIVSHWNANGQVDGYISKFWGLFLMPIISLTIALLFMWIPTIDPLKANIEKFRKYFDLFILFLTVFLFYTYGLTIAWNQGARFDMTYALLPALSVFIFYAGVLIEKSKRNWFIGIRTPWTLSSDTVWEKTHKIGGFLFKLSAACGIVGVLFGSLAVYFFLFPLIGSSIYLMFYSYFEFKKEQQTKANHQ